MKGIIILEGQDASGITYLANKLLQKYNGVYLHATYRFKTKIHIYHAALLRKALKLSKSRLVIIDRLFISEYIYAKVFRNGTSWPNEIKMFNNFCKKLNIPIVLCVPETIERGKIWFENAKKERIEMFSNIEQIIKEYCNYANKHKYDKNVLIYNRDFAQCYGNTYFEYIEALLKSMIGE